MNWLDNASIGTMTVVLLVAFFALGWILLKLCDVMVAIGAAFARWRAECEEPEDFAERDTVPPEQWMAVPKTSSLPDSMRKGPARCTGNCNQGRACVCRAAPPC